MSRPRLRVVLAPSAYYPFTGGIEEITRGLALELRRRGHAVLIVTNRWPAGTPSCELHDGVPVHRLRFELPARDVRALSRSVVRGSVAAWRLLRLMRTFAPSVIHVHGAGPPAVYVAALRRFVGVPIIFTAHGEFRNDAHTAFRRSRSLRWGLRSLLRHAAAVTAPSRVVLDELAEGHGSTVPGEVLPNAVEPAAFAAVPERSDPAGPYVLAAGRLVSQKGLDILLRAFALAGTSLGRRLVIAGAGPERPALEELAAELGLDGSVVFTGAVGRTRLAELMRGADLFAFPSRQEAFGIALLEAMASGTPAIASRVGGIPEFARDGDNALLVPVGDVESLAAALVRLADDDDLRRRLAEGGRAQAAVLSWDRLGPRYERLYERAIVHG